MKQATLNEVISYIDNLLKPEDFSDYCVNGIQVEGDRKTVRRVVLGVSSSLELFRIASKMDADLVIVHHGLFWLNTPSPFSLTGIMQKRIKELLCNGITLAAYHLPLDAHPEIGHAARIATGLKLQETAPWKTGISGILPSAVSVEEITVNLAGIIGGNPIHFDFSHGKPIRKVIVSTGASASMATDASLDGADLFIVGSLMEQTVRESEELGLSLIAGGHYNTEKPGIIALGEMLHRELGLETSFIDIPNPV